jgi:hypothetical protein
MRFCSGDCLDAYQRRLNELTMMKIQHIELSLPNWACGDSMSAFERLLEPGCTEAVPCQCGEEMEIASIERLPEGSDADVRVYHCSACHHEMRLTVWATIT